MRKAAAAAAAGSGSRSRLPRTAGHGGCGQVGTRFEALAFVRAPEGNGCAERFIGTLKEQLLPHNRHAHIRPR
jgi:hypothetical protein